MTALLTSPLPVRYPKSFLIEARRPSVAGRAFPTELRTPGKRGRLQFRRNRRGWLMAAAVGGQGQHLPTVTRFLTRVERYRKRRLAGSPRVFSSAFVSRPPACDYALIRANAGTNADSEAKTRRISPRLFFCLRLPPARM